MPIHIFKDSEGFAVWTDIEGTKPKRALDVQYGRCIGTGDTRESAIMDAVQELNADLYTLRNNPPATIEE